MDKFMDRIYTYQDLKHIQTFIYSLRRQAKSLGIKLIISSTKKFVSMGKDDVETSGYFDAKSNEQKGILGVGTKRPISEWLPVLVHESCHMDQWNEGLPIWKKSENMKYNMFDDWLMNKRCNKKDAYYCIDILRDIEIDCEKRSVEKIIKYDLPIDLKEYIRKANAYIFGYNWMKKSRKWINSEALYNNDVLSVIDTDWYEDYTETPKKIESMFKKYKV